MTKLHLKRYFSDTQRSILYLIAILLIAAIQLEFILITTQSNAFNISIVDNENSPKSHAYLKHLSANSLLNISTVSTDDQAHLLNGSVDALLIIPKNYFTTKDAKIELYYLKNNIKVPAIIDVLAMPLLPDILSNKLNIAAKNYGYPKDLSEHYKQVTQNLAASIDVNVHVLNSRKNVINEYALAKKEDKVQTIALSYFIIAILLILPLASEETKQQPIFKRLMPTISQRIHIFNTASLAEIIYYIIPVLIIAVSAYYQFDMPLKTILWLSVAGISVCFALYQLFKLIYARFDTSTATLIIMPFVILNALLCGAFFDSGLLSAQVKLLGGYLPLGTVATLYNTIYINGHPSNVHIITLFCYLLIGILLAVLNHLRLFSPKVTDNLSRR